MAGQFIYAVYAAVYFFNLINVCWNELKTKTTVVERKNVQWINLVLFEFLHLTEELKTNLYTSYFIIAIICDDALWNPSEK